MKMFCQTQGKGPELVLIHGWGLSGNVWEGIYAPLSQFARVTLLDLPGYGRSALMLDKEYNLVNLAAEIAHRINDDSIVLGWSLGGMIATQMAVNFPQKVKKLILVASSPQYYRSKNWPHAVDTEILQSFASELVSDYKETILRFLAIQALGSDHSQEEIRLLRQRVFRDGTPKPTALQAGLDILLSANLRPILSDIHCSSLIINGQNDRLVPMKSGQTLSKLIAKSQLAIFKGASHAPFISHPNTFIKLLEYFINV